MTDQNVHTKFHWHIMVWSMFLLLGANTIATAHDQDVAWLDESSIEDGFFVAVKHPTVVRKTSPIAMHVVVSNFSKRGTASVESITWSISGETQNAFHDEKHILPSHHDELVQYRSLVAKLDAAAVAQDRRTVARLTQEKITILARVAKTTHTDTFHVPEHLVTQFKSRELRGTVDIAILCDGVHHVLTRPFNIPIASPLPNGLTTGDRLHFYVATSEFADLPTRMPAARGDSTSLWFAGDQHLHTTYSLDALVLDGTDENVTDYAAAAEGAGLDWIIITDHSNVHASWGGTDYYTESQYNEGTAQAAAYSAGNELLALYGQEMGLGTDGFWDLPSHMLAYPLSVDSTGYLENPSSGLVFGLANCEQEQVIIDRITNAGGIGFIAHAFESGTLAFAQWDFNNGAIGWAGLELFSDTEGVFKGTDQSSYDKWHELLTEIAPPTLGALHARPGFPNPFPVGIGNSDAHEPGLIGKTFTYARLQDVERSNVSDALVNGRCVATNGPLVFATLNDARIGDVAILSDAASPLELTLQTTAEFGPVGTYQLTIFVDGIVRAIVPPSGETGFDIKIEIEGLKLAAPDTFLTIRADSVDGQWHAFTNPVWLQFTCTGDLDGDGDVGTTDLLSLLSQWGSTCPCSADIDRDGNVSVTDLLEVLNAWGNCS